MPNRVLGLMLVKIRPAAALTALAAAILLGGCRREEVTHFRVPKERQPTTLASAAPAPPAGDVAAPPRPAGALAWTLPKGWSEDVAGGMRYATLKAPVPGKLDVSIVVLPGPAGGELANVNRWRGQIGLPPVDEAALGAARKTVPSQVGPLRSYDFTGEGARSRMVVALAEIDGSTWFFKLNGDAAPVAAAKPDFIRLLESVRRGTR